MKPQQMMIGSLILLATIFAALPLKALATHDATTMEATAGPRGDSVCSAKMGHSHKGYGAHAKSPETMPPYLHGLKLSDSQKDQIFQLMHSKVPQFRELGKKARQTQEELGTLIFSQNFDAARAKSLTDSAARNHSEMLILRASVDQQIFSRLNAEQRKKVAAEIADKGMPPAM